MNISQYLSNRAYKEIRTIETSGYRTKHYQLTRGAVGCYLSHLNTYKKIAGGEAEFGLIFEDDVNISTSFFEKLNVLLKKIPNDWDILLLGCHCLKCKKLDVYQTVNKFILLHCYLIKKSSAEKLYNYLSTKRIEQQIDSELSDLIIDPSPLGSDFVVYCVNEAICWQSNTFATDIQIPVKVANGIDPFASVNKTIA